VGAGIIRYYRQDRPKSVRLLSEATRIYRRLGDARGVADSLIYQSISAVLVGDAQSEPMIRECVALWREMEDDRWRLALALWAQGAVWMTQERYDEAKAPLEESRALYEEIGDAWGIGAPLRLLGAIAASRGDLEAACRLLSQAVAAAREASDPWRLAYFSGCLGYELCTLGRYEEAAEAYEQCLALREQLGLRSDIFHAHIFLGRVRRSLRQWEESRRAYLCALEYARDLQRHPPWVGSPFDRRHVFGAEPRPSQSDIPLLDHLIAEAKQALRDMENPGSG
jgi:tetratricopeptide (TPR) repeat protein